MLKIKDNVDLKELEKFGFIEYNGWYYKTITPEKYQEHLNYIEVRVWKDRELYFTYCYEDEEKKYFFRKQDYCYGLDTIYDLIKADLVEKVEE